MNQDKSSESDFYSDEDTPEMPVDIFDRSIVEGNLASTILRLAWPTMLTNFIGGIQETIDHVIVGNLVGFKANAAIGIGIQIFLVIIVFVSSIFGGMGVLVARFAGASDSEKVNRTVYHAFIAAIIVSVGILIPLGYFASPYLLNLVSSDPGIKAEALPFLQISVIFSGGLVVYYMISSALGAAGDTKTPMILGVVITALNIILNIVFVGGFGPVPALGAAGAAIGTSVAAGVVGVYAIFRMCRGGWVVAFPKASNRKPNWLIIRSLFRFGLPTGIQGAALSIGGVLLFSFIDSLRDGSAVQAAFAVSSQLFAVVIWVGIGLMVATTIVTGQNLGAKKVERAIAAVKITAGFGLIVSLFIGIIFFFLPQQLLSIFGIVDGKVLDAGIQLLRIFSITGLFVSLALVYNGGLQGAGDTKGLMYISIFSLVVIPVFICFVLQKLDLLEPLYIWLAILTGHVVRCGLNIFRFVQGKWRQIIIEI